MDLFRRASWWSRDRKQHQLEMFSIEAGIVGRELGPLPRVQVKADARSPNDHLVIFLKTAELEKEFSTKTRMIHEQKSVIGEKKQTKSQE